MKSVASLIENTYLFVVLSSLSISRRYGQRSELFWVKDGRFVHALVPNVYFFFVGEVKYIRKLFNILGLESLGLNGQYYLTRQIAFLLMSFGLLLTNKNCNYNFCELTSVHK